MAANYHVTATIVVQPNAKVHFRYTTERRRPEPIVGNSSVKNDKTYPTLEISGYKGRMNVEAFCVTINRELHPHRLVDNQNRCRLGVYYDEIDVTRDSCLFKLVGVGVEHCVKDDFNSSISERAPLYPNFSLPISYDSVSKSQIMLCFILTYFHENRPYKLDPIFSDVIVDKRICSNLIIERLSKAQSFVTGDDEVFMLCSKIKKDDINVVFRDRENGWEGLGIFNSQVDIFKEVAIIFKVPPYHNQDIRHQVEVDLFLRQPSMNHNGVSKPFTYMPINYNPYCVNEKKRKLAAKLECDLEESYRLNIPHSISSTQNRNWGCSSSQFQNFPNYDMLPESVIAMQDGSTASNLIPNTINNRCQLKVQTNNKKPSTTENSKATATNLVSSNNMPTTKLPNSVMDINWSENDFYPHLSRIKLGSPLHPQQVNSQISIGIQKLSLEADSPKDKDAAFSLSSSSNQYPADYPNINDSVYRTTFAMNQQQAGDSFDGILNLQSFFKDSLNEQNILMNMQSEDLTYIIDLVSMNSQNISDKFIDLETSVSYVDLPRNLSLEKYLNASEMSMQTPPTLSYDDNYTMHFNRLNAGFDEGDMTQFNPDNLKNLYGAEALNNDANANLNQLNANLFYDNMNQLLVDNLAHEINLANNMEAPNMLANQNNYINILTNQMTNNLDMNEYGIGNQAIQVGDFLMEVNEDENVEIECLQYFNDIIANSENLSK